MEDGAELLVQAIVLQAMEDYRRARRILRLYICLLFRFAPPLLSVELLLQQEFLPLSLFLFRGFTPLLGPGPRLLRLEPSLLYKRGIAPADPFSLGFSVSR